MGLREKVEKILNDLKGEEPEEKLETSNPTIVIEVVEQSGAYVSINGFNNHSEVADVLLVALLHQIVEAAKDGELSLEFIKNLCINQINSIQKPDEVEDKEDEEK